MQSGDVANIIIALRKAEDHIRGALKEANKMLRHVRPEAVNRTLSTLRVTKSSVDDAMRGLEQLADVADEKKRSSVFNPEDDDVYPGDEYGSYDDEDDRYDKWR